MKPPFAQPAVAIVILNWNHPEDTLACLRSVAALDYPAVFTIVVDNGSTDDSVTRLRTAHPEIEIIATGANLGYTGGNNRGIRRALERGARYVWLLNDDAVAAPNALSLLVHAAEAQPDAAFLGPTVRMCEQPDRILSAGGILDRNFDSHQRGLGEVDQGQYAAITEVGFLSGCALLVSSQAMEGIGLLDERFFTYGEDVEWCFRGQRAGFKALHVPQAIVWHPDTRARDGNSARVMYYISRNHLLFLRKHQLGVGPIGRTLARNAIWLANWSINPKWRSIRSKRNALWLAMRDFASDRHGKCKDL